MVMHTHAGYNSLGPGSHKTEAVLCMLRWHAPPPLLHGGQDGGPAGAGTVTPGNASPMTDGAAALVLASRARAQQLGLPVLAVIRGHADANQAPEWWV